ncbi:HNH endonuclease [Chloroflexota bacterium]
MFNIGQIYRRADLHAQYKGQEQGGISTPSQYPFIMLFSGETGEQYGNEDGFQADGIYWYTGEGQVGDMQYIRGNRAILDSPSNGKSLHLFEYVGVGMVQYIGEMSYLGHHETQAPDRNGNLRQAIIFELALDQIVEEASTLQIPIQQVSDRILYSSPLEEIRAMAIAKSTPGLTPQQRKVDVYNRSQAIEVYVLRRADGVCEGCGDPAPFLNKDDRPYLEAHHIFRLSDDGPDYPDYVAALCPNCHRRAHYSKNGEKFNEHLFDKITIMESISYA